MSQTWHARTVSGRTGRERKVGEGPLTFSSSPASSSSSSSVSTALPLPLLGAAAFLPAAAVAFCAALPRPLAAAAVVVVLARLAGERPSVVSASVVSPRTATVGWPSSPRGSCAGGGDGWAARLDLADAAFEAAAFAAGLLTGALTLLDERPAAGAGTGGTSAGASTASSSSSSASSSLSTTTRRFLLAAGRPLLPRPALEADATVPSASSATGTSSELSLFDATTADGRFLPAGAALTGGEPGWVKSGDSGDDSSSAGSSAAGSGAASAAPPLPFLTAPEDAVRAGGGAGRRSTRISSASDSVASESASAGCCCCCFPAAVFLRGDVRRLAGGTGAALDAVSMLPVLCVGGGGGGCGGAATSFLAEVDDDDVARSPAAGGGRGESRSIGSPRPTAPSAAEPAPESRALALPLPLDAVGAATTTAGLDDGSSITSVVVDLGPGTASTAESSVSLRSARDLYVFSFSRAFSFSSAAAALRRDRGGGTTSRLDEYVFDAPFLRAGTDGEAGAFDGPAASSTRGGEAARAAAGAGLASAPAGDTGDLGAGGRTLGLGRDFLAVPSDTVAGAALVLAEGCVGAADGTGATAAAMGRGACAGPSEVDTVLRLKLGSGASSPLPIALVAAAAAPAAAADDDGASPLPPARPDDEVIWIDSVARRATAPDTRSADAPACDDSVVSIVLVLLWTAAAPVGWVGVNDLMVDLERSAAPIEIEPVGTRWEPIESVERS